MKSFEYVDHDDNLQLTIVIEENEVEFTLRDTFNFANFVAYMDLNEEFTADLVNERGEVNILLGRDVIINLWNSDGEKEFRFDVKQEFLFWLRNDISLSIEKRDDKFYANEKLIGEVFEQNIRDMEWLAVGRFTKAHYPQIRKQYKEEAIYELKKSYLEWLKNESY